MRLPTTNDATAYSSNDVVNCVRLTVLPLCLICVGARPASSAPVDLLQTYEPVLYFHASENWAPEKTEAFLFDARVERQRRGQSGSRSPDRCRRRPQVARRHRATG